MGTNKNSRSKTATLWARPPQTKATPTATLRFRKAGLPRGPKGVSPALLLPTDWRPRTFSAKFLIANPRLEFSATPTKQTTEPRSNRKKTAIFHPAFSLETRPQPIAQFLIETPRLEFSITPTKETTSQFLIDTKSGICIPNSFSRKPRFGSGAGAQIKTASACAAPLLAPRQHDNFQFH
jgi:hypothetical protein